MDYQMSLFGAATPAAPLRDDVAAVLTAELRGILVAANLDQNRQGIAVRRYSEAAKATPVVFAAICRQLALDQAAPPVQAGMMF
jgi:hypothetical protein